MLIGDSNDTVCIFMKSNILDSINFEIKDGSPQIDSSMENPISII